MTPPRTASSVGVDDAARIRRLERAVAESDRRYRCLALATGAAFIFVVNHASEVDYANDITATRFGFTVDDIVGRRLEDVIPRDAVAETSRILAACSKPPSRGF